MSVRIRQSTLNNFKFETNFSPFRNIYNVDGKRIPLEMHYIDGDCTNNKMENLQLLCPNCHSLASNFGSFKQKLKKVSQVKENIE